MMLDLHFRQYRLQVVMKPSTPRVSARSISGAGRHRRPGIANDDAVAMAGEAISYDKAIFGNELFHLRLQFVTVRNRVWAPARHSRPPRGRAMASRRPSASAATKPPMKVSPAAGVDLTGCAAKCSKPDDSVTPLNSVSALLALPLARSLATQRRWRHRCRDWLRVGRPT